MHTSPAQAVEVFKIINSTYMIPVHYDTFELTDDKYDDPLSDFTKAIKLEKIPSDRIKILTPGQTITLPN